MGTQNGTLVNGTMDQHLRNPPLFNFDPYPIDKKCPKHSWPGEEYEAFAKPGPAQAAGGPLRLHRHAAASLGRGQELHHGPGAWPKAAVFGPSEVRCSEAGDGEGRGGWVRPGVTLGEVHWQCGSM